MNTNELRAERIRQGKTSEDLGKVIGKTTDAYSKKERGLTRFSSDEISAIANELNLSYEKVDLIFFNSTLPSGSVK